MNKLKENFDNNYLLGLIQYNGTYDFYLMPIAWWILNHQKYDPFFDTKKWGHFRNKLYNILDKDITHFLYSIAEDKLQLEDLEWIFNNIDVEFRLLRFFIDFDKKVFVNGFEDIDVEDYLPDSTWRGIKGNPLLYIPQQLKNIKIYLYV